MTKILTMFLEIIADSIIHDWVWKEKKHRATLNIYFNVLKNQELN